jgi:hypothetical protein
MQIRRMTMNSNSGKEMYLKFTAYPVPETIRGKRTINKTIMANIMLNAIIKYLNFTEIAPIMNIKERLFYVNDVDLFFQGGE